MNILNFILLFGLIVLTTCQKDTKEYSKKENFDDAVVVEAPQGSRSARHLLLFASPRASSNWNQALGEGSPCLTSRGHLGACTSYRLCYPYFKLPDLALWESWVLGNYDTCSYFDDYGRQAFGVCCTNVLNLQPTIDEFPEVINSTSHKQPNNNNVISSWPPKPITHPPDHTPATHPPHFGQAPTTPAPMPITTTTTTRKPATTWPTRPPSTPYPGFPSWPPPAPTHPTTPRPPTQRPPTIRPPTSRPPTVRPPPPVAPIGGAGSSPGSQPSDIPVDGSCGAKNGNQDQERIVGGHNADPNEWPWVAVLFNGGRQFCGGSLIDDIHILTAAHCVAHMSSWDVARLTVRLGDHNIRSNTEVKHVERKIKRVVRHRGFDSRTLYNDVALLTMDSAVMYTKAVRPVCLPAGGGARLYNGMTGTVIGWGSLRENGPQPAILQEVSIPIWANAECRRKYGSAAPGGIVESMICAGQAAKDSCSGDSGGPLMVTEGGRWTQVGVVSWGIGCGKGQYPGVYTRVTHFMPWITKNLKENK